MTCSFCNKSASKQYYLCDCCFVNLKHCNAAAKSLSLTQQNPVSVVPTDEDAELQTIECDLCLRKFQEDTLQQHREKCTTLLVFRCAVCQQDYMTKEGLWNHLDLHEVADENKQMKSSEVRVANSLLKCVLCNDQRGYQETLYWQHVHEDHDGFFLQCSECKESFRSQKLLSDHTLNHCNGREQAVPSLSNDTSTEKMVIDDDTDPRRMEDDKSKLDLDKLIIDSTTVETSQPIVEKMSSGSTFTAKCPHCDKVYLDKTLLVHHIKYRHPTTKCDICNIRFTSSIQARYHKLKYHADQKHKCPQCSMKFDQKIEFQRHLSKHLDDRRSPNEIRPPHQTATILPDLEGCSEPEKPQEQGSDVNLLQDQYEIVTIKEEMSVEEDLPLEQQYNADADAGSYTVIHCPICGGKFGNQDENHLAVHVELIHQLYICTSCGIIFPTADQLKDHQDKRYGGLCSNRDPDFQSVPKTEPIEMVEPSSSHYASSSFENTIAAVAPIHDLNPTYSADEDASNCSSFDGWEVYSTVPGNEIESYVLSIEFGFRFKTQNAPSKGKMRYYQCRRIKVRITPQCERKLLVFIPSTDEIPVVSLKGKHTCVTAPPELLTRPKYNEMDMESMHRFCICKICGIVFSTDDQLKSHGDQQHSAIDFDIDTNYQSVLKTEPIETVEASSSPYASTSFESPTSTVATLQESVSHSQLNPPYPPDDGVSNSSSFDGWEVYSTIPVNDIESYVLSVEYGFRFKTQNAPSKGKMRYYQCRRIKVRVSPQCERKLLAFIPHNDPEADATISLKGKHTCEQAPPENLTRPKLNEMDCELITNLVKSGVPSKDVRKHVRVINNTVSDHQLSYAVQSARKSVIKK